MDWSTLWRLAVSDVRSGQWEELAKVLPVCAVVSVVAVLIWVDKVVRLCAEFVDSGATSTSGDGGHDPATRQP